MEHGNGNVGRSAALIYTTLSLLAAFVFWLVATVLGGYTPVATYGGAAWVFLLTLIVSMPLVSGAIKRRSKA